MGLPDMTDDALRKGLGSADKLFTGIGTAFGIASTVDATAKLVENVQHEGWSTESAFKAFDVTGNALKLVGGKSSVVGYLGGVAIHQWTDVAREAQKVDFSYPMPPLTAENITTIYLPGAADGLVSGLKLTWGNL